MKRFQLTPEFMWVRFSAVTGCSKTAWATCSASSASKMRVVASAPAFAIASGPLSYGICQAFTLPRLRPGNASMQRER